MKAARFHAERQGCTVEEVPLPSPTPGEVRVAIKSAGLCGTDLHVAWERSFPTATSPITLGHEGAGVITAVGAEVADWNSGDRVIFYPSVPCGACRACLRGRVSLCATAQIFGIHRDGTFAESVSVPAEGLVRLPDSVSFDTGAILSDAVATAYHAVIKRGALQPGESVAVFGVGGVGYHSVLFAKQAGASRIIAVDTAAGALTRAEQAGATEVIRVGEDSSAKAIRTLTNGDGVDVAFEFVGRGDTVNEAMRSVARPGRVVVVGVGAVRVELPPLTSFVGKELAVIGSMGSYREDLAEVLALVSDGQIDLSGSVTHEFRLEEINEAFEALAEKKGDPVRIVVRP